MEYPKYKLLFEGATIHEEQDEDLVSRVRSGSHVFIEWKLNLLNLMKKEFLANNNCDFALGEFYREFRYYFGFLTLRASIFRKQPTGVFCAVRQNSKEIVMCTTVFCFLILR
jgi:hypothetical protein